MVIALVTVFRTKRRSVKRRKSMKDLDSGDRANLDLFKYVSILFNMLKFSEHLSPAPGTIRYCMMIIIRYAEYAVECLTLVLCLHQ